MKTIKILDLDELGTLEFKEHPSFLDSIQAVKFFENGLGVSVICKSKDVMFMNQEKLAIHGNFSTSAGSWEDGTYEIAVLVGDENLSFFEMLKNISDTNEDYEINGGIWQFKRIDQLKEIVSQIKNISKPSISPVYIIEGDEDENL
jgi:hypothetical protein